MLADFINLEVTASHGLLLLVEVLHQIKSRGSQGTRARSSSLGMASCSFLVQVFGSTELFVSFK
jgi:hypothetical protein